MGDYLLEHRTEIAELLTLEAGKPCWEALIGAEGAAVISNIMAIRRKRLKDAQYRLVPTISTTPSMNHSASLPRSFRGIIRWK